MAGAGDVDMLPVNCGVRLDGSSFILSYEVGKNVDIKNIEWDWHETDGMFIAKMRAKTKSGDIKYHNSAPIDADTIIKKLGKAKKASKISDGMYFDVKIKKKDKDVPDMEEFFNVAQ